MGGPSVPSPVTIPPKTTKDGPKERRVQDRRVKTARPGALLNVRLLGVTKGDLKTGRVQLSSRFL